MPRAAVFTPATDRQVAFIGTLAAERVLPADLAILAGGAADLSRRAASDLITALLALPKVAAPAREGKRADGGPALPNVPAARYALEGADGAWEFYQVDRPTKGKWAGYTFVKRLFGAPGDFRQERLTRAQTRGVLDRVLVATYRDGADRLLTGPEAAAVAFSREHGVCAACLAPLTDPDSIRYGLGPICRGRFAF